MATQGNEPSRLKVGPGRGPEVRMGFALLRQSREASVAEGEGTEEK